MEVRNAGWFLSQADFPGVVSGMAGHTVRVGHAHPEGGVVGCGIEEGDREIDMPDTIIIIGVTEI